jgi:hypothetical protein
VEETNGWVDVPGGLPAIRSPQLGRDEPLFGLVKLPSASLQLVSTQVLERLPAPRAVPSLLSLKAIFHQKKFGYKYGPGKILQQDG